MLFPSPNQKDKDIKNSISQPITRDRIPQVFDLKPILSSIIRQTSELVPPRRHITNTFNTSQTHQFNENFIFFESPNIPANVANVPNYILERENLVGMKSHAMAATEDKNYLIYAFATHFESRGKNRKTHRKEEDV